jgi:hypothetical protein
MKQLSEYLKDELFIIQPSIWKSFYELKYKEEIIGTMQLVGFFDHKAIIKFDNESYEFYKEKFWKKEILIRKKGFEIPTARYVDKLFSQIGIVNLDGGHSVRIKFYPFKSKYEIISEKDDLLVSFKSRVSFKHQTNVVVKSTEQVDKNPWLIFLAEFLKLQRNHAAVAAA